MYQYNKIDFFNKTYIRLLYFPNSKCRWGYRGSFIIWEFYAISKSGRKYTLCLNYEKGYSPRIWIVEPDLTSGKLPHVYSTRSNQLCLYHTNDFQWSKDKDIIKTIFLWALVWIEFYEFYQELGEWLGPEFDHAGLPKQEGDGNTGSAQNKFKINGPKYLKKHPIRY